MHFVIGSGEFLHPNYGRSDIGVDMCAYANPYVAPTKPAGRLHIAEYREYWPPAVLQQ